MGPFFLVKEFLSQIVVVVAVVVFVRFNIKISEGTIHRRLLKWSSCGASIFKKI